MRRLRKIDYPDAILNRRMSAQECWTLPTMRRADGGGPRRRAL